MNYYVEMLKKSIKRIEADYDFSAIINHNGSKGTFREYILKKFLIPFLPGCYGVSGGQAFDNAGNTSRQLDVAIYDRFFSYIAPYMDDFIYFPCESVYGSIEIKSILNKQSFEDAIKNIASLKRLPRERVDSYYVNPMKPLKISNVAWDVQATNEYLGIIFAYEGASASTVLEYMKDVIDRGLTTRENLPNIIVLFKEQRIITRYHLCEDGMYEIHPLGEYQGFLVEECGDNILAEFLVLLFASLHSIELRALDIQKLSVELHRKIFADSKKSIENIRI